MADKKRLSVADVKAEGFVEGVDFYINHSGLPVPLTPNKIRPCEACGNKKAHFYSALHRKCRTCRRREQDGVVPGSAGAIAREAARLERRGDLSSGEAKKQAVAAHQKELAARILARRRLLQFIRKFHPGYQAGWVHEDICRRLERFLQAVADKKSPRLLLFCPPRLGKSLIASQYFPAWMLGQHPQFEIIAASYNISLPTGFSRRIRELVRDPEYTAMFPDCVLSEESQAVESWRTTAGGGYTAAGVGTGITGKGCHCVVGHCTVDTPDGPRRIDSLVTGDVVYSFNHDQSVLDSVRVEATRKVAKNDIYTITTLSGKRIVITGDHPVYVPGAGYVPAEQLEVGQPLLTVAGGASDVPLQRVREADVRTTRVFARAAARRDKERELFPGVYYTPASEAEEMCDVWHTVRGAEQVLLAGMSGELPAEAGVPQAGGAHDTNRQGMPSVRGGVQAEVSPDSVLHSGLRGRSALSPHGRQRESEFPGGSAAPLNPVQAQDTECGDRPRWGEVLRVWLHKLACSASPRRGRDERLVGEPRNRVRLVPQEAPQVCYDPISSIERDLSKFEWVYDIQTERGNFVLNTLVVHNCLIVDDPVKDQEAADSANIREATWEWYLSTAYTRIAPGGGVLGIQTRWNDDDWSGRIIMAMDTGEGEKFEIVSYPAINEQGDEYLMPDDSIVQIAEDVTPPEGAQLLRLKGSALHPDRYDISHLQRIKKNFTAAGNVRMWSALYQQNPVPEEGAFFRRDMFKYISYVPDATTMQVYQAWDFSITEKETSDWIVGYCLGQDEFDNVYELDMIRFKSDENAFTIADAILDFYRKWPTFLVGFEDGQIWKSIKAVVMRRAEELRMSLNYETLTPLSDKLVRAGPLRGRMQMGKMYFQQNAPFRQTVDQELLRFPGGKHDDIVDAAAWATRLALTHQPPAPVKAKPMPSWKDGLFRAKRGESHMAA